MTPEPTSGSIAAGAPVQPLYDPQRLAALATAAAPRAAAQPGPADYAIATVLCLAIVAAFMAHSREVAHWFLMPLMCCGILVGSDAVRWLRGAYDTFDPKGLVGLLGLHFFFVAPLLFVSLGGVMVEKNAPSEFRPWMGLMGGLNAAGLVLYKLAERRAARGTKVYRTIWAAEPGRTTMRLGAAVAVSVVCALALFVVFGGFRGLAQAATEEAATFAGWGIPRIIAYALPLLLLIFITAHRQQKRLPRAGLILVALVLGAVFAAQFFVVGGTTSRGATMTSVVWALLVVHYMWGRINRRMLIYLMLPGLMFLWLMSIYKYYGLRLQEYVSTGSTIAELSDKSNRTFAGMLIGDLSRTDVHASLAHARRAAPYDAQLRYGMTYPAGVFPMIPRWIWFDRPADSGKVVAGTDWQHGRGYYRPYTTLRSSRAYGIGGEALINFGFLGVPLAYGVLGWLIGRHRRSLRALHPGDFRAVWLAYWTYFLVNMLLWDSDNYIAHTVMRAVIPLAVLYVATVRRPAPPVPLQA